MASPADDIPIVCSLFVRSLFGINKRESPSTGRGAAHPQPLPKGGQTKRESPPPAPPQGRGDQNGRTLMADERTANERTAEERTANERTANSNAVPCRGLPAQVPPPLGRGWGWAPHEKKSHRTAPTFFETYCNCQGNAVPLQR